jgi:hypothetical protein
MPTDRAPERQQNLFESPTTMAAGLSRAAWDEIAKMQKYALTGDSRQGGNSGCPFLGPLGAMLGALYDQTSYPHHQRLREMFDRHRNQQGQQDQA